MSQNSILRIEDNKRLGQSVTDTFDAPIEGDMKGLLDAVANKKVSELCNGSDDNSNLLIFPDSFTDSLKGQKEAILENKPINGEDTLFTGNILGFIGKGNASLQIVSRFDKGYKDDKDDTGKQNYFLHYMLQKVMSINLFDLKTSTSKDSIWDFLIYMFPEALNRAIRQGLYKEYRYFDRNDDHIRGTIDVARHITLNMPFRGKIAYRVREHTPDNKVTQLIRHTIEFIREKPQGRSILSSYETKDAVSTIVNVTPSYERFSRQRVIAQNLRGFSHPFYNAYRPLVKLCLQILRYERLSYGMENDKLYGILFDGAWLWEEYMATLLRDLGFEHPQNKIRKGALPLYNNNRGDIYPDFYFPDPEDKMRDSKDIKSVLVLDAKYKHLDEKPQGEDVFQIISYMHVLKSNCGIFLYPSQNETQYNENGVLNGYGGKVGSLAFHIPKYKDNDNFENFCKAIADQEAVLKTQIGTLLDNIRNTPKMKGKTMIESSNKKV